MAILKILKYRLCEQNREGGEGGDEPARPSPAEVNQRGNNARLSRIEEIGRVADGQRATQLEDTDGNRVTGRFQGGEFDDSAEARERAAEEEEERARTAIEEERRREEDEEGERSEAARLQAEGGGDPGEGRGDESPDEKVINGVRHYLTVVNGQERWLTLKQLRDNAAASAGAEDALQRAQDALRSAAQAELTPKEAPAEVDDKDLENVILSASMGDEEAVRKLVQVIRTRPTGQTPEDVSRLVSQQIATQREVDRAEQAQKDITDNELLAPVFRQRLRDFAQSKPNTRIGDAYKAIGDQMRKDFAPMLASGSGAPASKADRKRSLITPPSPATRQQRREQEDREVPVSDEIDAIAKSRGQDRAHRIRRS